MPDATTSFVHLLGQARVVLGADLQPFGVDQRYQLLAYLAWRGEWVERDFLSHLFWPESAPDTARGNLRHLLGRTRALGLAPGLEVERGRLRWAVPTDLADFTRAVEEERWEEALGRSREPLLEGLDTAGTGEFAAWLERERERLRGLWRTALLCRAAELGTAGAHLQAAELLGPLLEGDLDEEVLHAHVGALLRAGGRGRARRAYETFVARLRGEYGLEPTASLEGLGRTLRAPAGEPPTGSPPPGRPRGEPAPTPRPSLPTPTTSFVGRDLELAEVGRLLSGPDCRLLTLTGPGGIGKTRLALEAARALSPTFPAGVFFVSLDALTSAALIPTQIARVLGVQLPGQGDPLEGVVGAIGEGRMLVVLDNFEHLLEGAPGVQDLLGRCPGLRLIVTSRERLGVEAEWLLPVQGLAYPEGGSCGPVRAGQFDAVELFVERARRVHPDFTPTGESLPHLLRLCLLVEGAPLALELAAVWVRALSLEEIARELGENLDFLGPGERGRPERHRSLRAVFEHSWRRLSPAEQEVLAGLAVFRGGFRLEAARGVVGAPLPVLASLVDQSLLRTHPTGRYGRHALLVQYAREKLAGDPVREAELRARHGAYFLRFLQDLGGALRGPDQKAALAAVDADLENVRLAWGWAVEERRAGDLGRSAAPLADYCTARARYREGVEWLAGAEAALGDGEPAHRAALCQLWVAGAPLLHRLGRHAEAERWAERGLGAARELGQDEAALPALTLLGTLTWRRGDYRQARILLEEAVALARARGDAFHLADSLNLLGNVTLDGGDLPGAERHYAAALALHRTLGHQAEVVRLHNNLGCLAAYQGHLGESVDRLQEGLRLARDVGLPRLTAQLLSSLAETEHEQGDFACAAATAREALDLARQSGDRRLEGILLMDLGRTATAAGELERGERHLREGLHLLWSLGELPQVLRTLARWAEWHLAAAQPGRAAELLALVAAHPKTKGVDRGPARRLRAELDGEGAALADPDSALTLAVAELTRPPP
ncbi:ATP-binding protein [Deinococcus planocerae]|uniref:ATP-binding protein n=1 Tax=Deinococcus planocerae TaxID=1737569 RepID=UPI0015E10CDA|nr:tetratricopeptide repeat protein [Deinococcus planocerae]